MLLKILSIISISIIKCASSESDLLYIDAQTKRYLLLEKSLWGSIAASDDQQANLVNIHSEHIKFIKDTYSEFVTESEFLFYESIGKYSFTDLVFDIDYDWKFTDEYFLKENVTVASRNDTLSHTEYKLHKTYFRVWNALGNATYEENYFEDVRKAAQNQSCSNRVMIQSDRQLIYKFYDRFATMYLKTYALIQLSLMLQTVFQKGNHSADAAQLHQSFKEESIKFHNKVKKVMETTDGITSICDRSFEYQTNTDYQVTNFIQGYIDNEINLNREQTCTKSCSDFTKARNYGCAEGTFCDKRKNVYLSNMDNICNGDIRDCRFIEGDMRVCFPWKERESYRPVERYAGITFKSGKIIGEDSCSFMYSPVSIESWWTWFVQCSNCICYCDDIKYSDRYFSLRPVLSNVKENKVITGVVLRKTNRLFHWRITEKVITTNGRLNVTDIWTTYNEWDQHNIDDSVNGIDYHTLKYENRSINLDTLVAPTGSTVTGIRFNVFEGHLNLEIRATKFDFNSGKLSVQHEWISNSARHRSEIKLENPDIPHPNDVFVRNKEPNKYVKFQPTDIDKDIAQHTVPFIDIFEVPSSYTKPTLLSGIGLVWKGKRGSGGVISPVIVSYDYSSLIGQDYDY